MRKSKTKAKIAKWKEYGGNRSYEFTPEADEALDMLKEKLGKNRVQLVNEAVIQMAQAHGLKIKSRTDSITPAELKKKTDKLERVVKALCRNAIYYECEADEGYDDKVRKSIQEAVNSGTRRNADALWEKLKTKLPSCLKDEDAFLLYLTAEGIPSRRTDR